MPKNKRSRLQSTRNKENGASSKQRQLTGSDIPLRRLFLHINELPLYLFIDCIVDKRYWALVINGTFTEEEVIAAWEVIVDQYNAALGDSEGKLYLFLYKLIALKEIDIQMIYQAVNILRIVYNKPFADRLNKLLGTSFKFNPDDGEEYLKLLTRCLNRTKGLQLDLDRRKMEFEAIKKRHEGERVEPTREYFQTVLINLSDFAKYPVDDKIKTFEFCERFRRLTKYLEKERK